MSASTFPQPPLRPIGPVWREIRDELGVRQQDVADILGFGSGGQGIISHREKDPSEPGAVAPRIEELTKFEDHYGLQRGTILRRAGHVVDAEDPLQQLSTWTWLKPDVRAFIRRALEHDWAEVKESRRPRPKKPGSPRD